jgi:hypothetical protein
LPNADGTAGQFLKTDGSTNLSWDSAATQISLTAKGTIAAGKPVSLITSGTDSGKGVITSTGVGTTLVKGAVSYPDGESTDYLDNATDNTTDARTDKMVYGRHSGNVYFLGRRDNRQNVITAGTINASTGAITWGTTVVVSTTGGGIGSLVECKNYSGTTVVVWIGNISTNTQYAVYTVSGTSLSAAKSLTTISTSSIGDEAEVGEAIECVGKAADGYGSGASNNYDPIAFSYHQQNSIFDTSYMYHRFAGFTDSSNVNTLAFGATKTLGSSLSANVDDNSHMLGGLAMVWDPDNLLSVVIHGGSMEYGNYKIRQFEITASNFNSTERGSETNLDGTETGYYYADWTYDESINRVIGLVTRDPAESTGNGTLGFIIETNDSGNPTVTKKTAANTGISTPDSNDRTQYVQIAHNSASSTNYSTAFIDSSSGASSDKFVMQPITASTTAITGQSYESGTNVEDLVAAGDIADKTAAPNDSSQLDDFHPSALVAAVNVNMFVFAWRGPVGNNLAPRAMAFGYTTFDYEDQFIGVAQNAVSDGQTVNVKSLGQIDTQQSGLTTGSLVYVDSGTSAITATSTDNTEIGRAISASSFVVTKLFNS